MRVDRVIAMGLVACVAMTAEARGDALVPFTEEAFARGLVYHVQPPAFGDGYGRGVAFVDLDQDGDADVVAVGRAGGVVGVFENDGTGRFTDRSAGSGAPLVPAGSSVTAADYDNDGDLDVHVAAWVAPNVLLRNEGGFTFTDVSAEAGVDDDGAGTGAAWGDFDGDGWMDLYVPNYSFFLFSSARNRFYRNNGDGTFRETAADLGLDSDEWSFQAVFLDYDRDGDADLYLSNDKAHDCDGDGPHNHLFENVGGAYVDVTDESGTAACIDSMGVAVGDFDRNGWTDLYCTNVPLGNPLFLNAGNGVFVEQSELAGVASYLLGWGALFLDYDNDAHVELYVCNEDGPNRLYKHDGDLPCVDVAPAVDVDTGLQSYCAATADVDGDGDLDLLVQTAGQRLRLYVNHEGTQRSWVKLRVRGAAPDLFGIGTVVEVQAGGVTQIREVLGASGYKSQSEMTLHVGLGDATSITRVTARWPGGTQRQLANLAVDRTWTLLPPEALLDPSGDGIVDAGDVPALLGCWTGAGGAIEPGCEALDPDGDGDVDALDLDAFLAAYAGPLLDCDADGTPDLAQIVTGAATDGDGDGVLDACEAAGDLDGSGATDVEDVLAVLAGWGHCAAPCPPSCAADANGDCAVDVIDLLVVLGGWG